jgi:hypothetical protein
MKHFILMFALTFAVSAATAQVITGCEYFFDTDPGIGNGTSIAVTNGDSVIISTAIPTTGLASGFHRIYIRAQNIDGVWSLYEGRTFFIQDPLPLNTTLEAAEYFFDTDPGVGNGTAFTTSPGDSIIINTTVPTTGLSNGFHKMFVRAKDASGKWSLYEGRNFYIQEALTANTSQLSNAEYFYDTDPGVGNGTALNVTAGDSLVITTIAPTTTLSNGFHKLFVRVKNTDNRWSHYEGRTFYILAPPDDQSQLQLDYAEYFFDTDPGQGSATPLAITAGDSIDGNFNIPEGLPMGAHKMVLRARNSNAKWSLNEGREFLVGVPGVFDIDQEHPTLFQNYPNPFSASTKIEFNLLKKEDVRISISDLPGNTIMQFSMMDLPPGRHSLLVDGYDLESGYYMYRMMTNDFSTTKQMVILK